MTKTSKLAAAAIVAAMTMAGTVQADPVTTNTPGSACVASTGTLTARADGEAENLSASYVTAVCPVERPIGTGQTTTKVSGQVWVVDQNPSGNVCCMMVSQNANGATVMSSWSCSSGSSSGYQILSLPQITDAYTYSHYFVRCSLPPSYSSQTSRIQMYRTTQQ